MIVDILIPHLRRGCGERFGSDVGLAERHVPVRDVDRDEIGGDDRAEQRDEQCRRYDVNE